MQMQWYGHSCFLLTSGEGVRILTDPCAPTTGYRLRDIETDAVTSSHAHYDHNYFVAAAGSPAIINTPGAHAIHGVTVTGIPTFHDNAGGSERGSNTVYVIRMDGLRIVHLGDLGHLPDAAACAAIGTPDVLLIPVGGTYTLDAGGACETVGLLKPRIVVPMHYQTSALAFPLDPVEPFLTGLSGWTIHRLQQSECTITRETLGTPRVLVFNYQK